MCEAGSLLFSYWASFMTWRWHYKSIVFSDSFNDYPLLANLVFRVFYAALAGLYGYCVTCWAGLMPAGQNNLASPGFGDGKFC